MVYLRRPGSRRGQGRQGPRPDLVGCVRGAGWHCRGPLVRREGCCCGTFLGVVCRRRVRAASAGRAGASGREPNCARNTLAANPPANLTPYPAEPVPPTVPATAANTVMPLPLAASGPVGAVMPYDPTIPEPAPLAAPTLVNRKKANDAAWKAAEAERKRLARLDKKKRAREAAGLPAVEPPVVLTAQQLKSKNLRKERNRRGRQKLKNTQAAHHLDVDSDE